MTLQELEKEKASHLTAADRIVAAAQRQKQDLTQWEKKIIDNHMTAVSELNTQIAAAKPKSIADVQAFLDKQPRDIILQPTSEAGLVEPITPKRFSKEYHQAFYSRLGRKGPALTSALYEGASGSGGYAVPIVVDSYIAPLAPTASDIRDIATVIDTTKDVLLPSTAPAGLPTTTQTAELTGFTQSTPSLGQTKLSAYLNALLAPVSLELAEDVPGLEAWMRTVVEAALIEQEDALMVSGTGSNEIQGLIGNVGAGVIAEPDGGSNLVTFAGLSALLATVKPKYLAGSSFLMSQNTAIVARAALAYSGATFEWTRGADGVERLFGYPVKYSASMPAAQRGNAPVLFGNFKMGYIVGDRGGPAVRLKILDQMFGVNGTLYWLLSRRTDARVWVQEAIQQYNIAAS
jgi:HK97 family phage major capsid protein